MRIVGINNLLDSHANTMVPVIAFVLRACNVFIHLVLVCVVLFLVIRNDQIAGSFAYRFCYGTVVSHHGIGNISALANQADFVRKLLVALLVIKLLQTVRGEKELWTAPVISHLVIHTL